MRAGRRRVRLTHPDKVLFPADGITKADLAAYYAAVAPAMVPHVRDRPLNLWRWNAGIDRPVVIQQEIPKGAPDWVRRVSGAAPARAARVVPRGRRRDGDARLARQPELHHAAFAGPAAPTVPTAPTGSSSTSTRRTTSGRATSSGSAPGALVLGDAPARARPDAARDDVRLPRHPRRRRRCGAGRTPTPCAPAPGEIAEELAARRPDELTTEWRKVKRDGRVLVDVARNTYGQTAVAPYAVRARPGAPVATPLAWEELEDPELHPRRWTLASVPDRLERIGDPWEGIGRAAARLPAAMT